jgi:hydrogenase-1 operon protein HyaF
MSFPTIEIPPPETGNLKPLLHEIAYALNELIANGIQRTIDLRALPLAPGEEQRLLQILGTGEIGAELDALGKSSIQESRFPGVWITTHFSRSGEIMGRFIEITRTPELLSSQPEDMVPGLDTLRQFIATGSES